MQYRKALRSRMGIAGEVPVVPNAAVRSASRRHQHAPLQGSVRWPAPREDPEVRAVRFWVYSYSDYGKGACPRTRPARVSGRRTTALDFRTPTYSRHTRTNL